MIIGYCALIISLLLTVDCSLLTDFYYTNIVRWSSGSRNFESILYLIDDQ